MSGLDLDETESHMFERAMNGYGAVVSDGTDTERRTSLEDQFKGTLSNQFIVIDGREHMEQESIFRQIVSKALGLPEDKLEEQLISSVDVRQALGEAGRGIAFLEFDSMPADLQTNIARLSKGIAESREFDGRIAFTSESGDAVVRAEPDLSGRVRSWSID